MSSGSAPSAKSSGRHGGPSGRSRTSATSRRSRVVTAGTALILSAGLSGCQFMSPTATEFIYNPGEGVMLTIDDIAVRDLLVISQGYGAPGIISGLVVNTGTETGSVMISVVDAGAPIEPPEPVVPSSHTEYWPPALAVDADSSGQPIPVITAEDIDAINAMNAQFALSVDVAPDGALRLLSEGDAATVPAVATSGGSLMTLQVTTGSGVSENVVVPVVYPQEGSPFADFDPGPSPLVESSTASE